MTYNKVAVYLVIWHMKEKASQVSSNDVIVVVSH